MELGIKGRERSREKEVRKERGAHDERGGDAEQRG